jgi:uncharacterized protein YcnI
MRCSAWSSLAISVCSGLLFVGAADAHVVPLPAYVVAGEPSRVLLSVPNERGLAMTGVSVTLPRRFHIAAAGSVAEWTATVRGRTATWSGGRLPPTVTAYLPLDVQAHVEPGQVTFVAKETYPDGEAVRWPVTLTVVPAEKESQNLGLALVVGIVGLVAITGLGLLLARRRVTRGRR